MKVSVDQYCINVSDLARSVDFYENAIGLKITHRVEEKEFREVILQGEGGPVAVYNLKHIQNGKQEDPILRGGEIVVIDRRFF